MIVGDDDDRHMYSTAIGTQANQEIQNSHVF